MTVTDPNAANELHVEGLWKMRGWFYNLFAMRSSDDLFTFS